MKRVSTFFAALFLTVAVTFADLPFRNHRYDAFKTLPVTSENIVFIGNSITNMHEWWEAFDDHSIVNRGVSGAVTDEALANIEAIAAGKPKKVFMMLGTNDLGTAGINTAEHVLQNVKLMVERFQKVSPTTQLYIQSILPSGKRDQALQQATNTALKVLCEEKGITYIDLWDDLLGVATNSNGLSYDNLHLTADAYKIWCDKVAPYVTDDNASTSVYTSATQANGGLGGSHGMRATVFSKLPVNNDDILIIGDEMVHGGEWHELLKSPRVKSRGTGWGYAGMSLTNMIKMVDPIFHDGAKPAQVYLHIGVDDVVFQTTELTTILANYKAVVERIQQLSLATEVVMTSVLPMSNTAKNTDRVAPFNALLKAYADESPDDKLHYLDIYTDFVTEGNVANATYFNGNYLYGKGYVKVAQKIAGQVNALDPEAGITAITDEEANAAYTRFGNRTALGNAIVQAASLPEGDGVGYYTAANLAGVKEQIEAAYTALANSDNATDTFAEEMTAFTPAIDEVLPKINQPTCSTEDNEVWYKLSTPNRGSRYLTSKGAGEGVVGDEQHNYATGMWKFVKRADEGVDIINRHDRSYLAPTAAYNTQITTSDTQPAKGWTLSHANTAGLFIVSSGNVQLNQTQAALSYKVYNWSTNQTGADRADAGCQYLVTLVEGEPDALPEVDPSVNPIPQVGKYYRFGYNFGGSVGVRYMQSTASSVKGLEMTTEKGVNSIFYVVQVDGNTRIQSYATGKYLHENGGTRGLHDTGGNVTFSEGAAAGQVKIQATSYLHANSSGSNYFVDHCGSDGGHATHNFIAEEVKAYTLTIDGPAAAGATATWNGETKPIPATWALFEGMGVTDGTLTINCTSHQLETLKEGATTISGNMVEISSLTANRTFTTEFSPAFFSATYGEKWVRLSNCSNPAYWATLQSDEANGKGTTATLDYADEKQLWCLVGNAASFVLYNKAAGDALALNVPLVDNATAYADGNQALLTTEKGTWKLIGQNFGYALVPTEKFPTNTMGINMYGGNAGLLKLYGTAAGNRGSYWNIEAADVDNPLTLNVKVNGTQPYATNYRVAEMAVTVDGTTSSSCISGSTEATKYYLPVGATFSLANQYTYRGYTFKGYQDAQGNAATYTDATVPTGGLSLTAVYDVDAANKYQYLFYSNDPVMGKPYRIPAIAVNREGTVLAVTDHRPGGNDVGFAEVDIKIRRSDDYVNWTDEEFIANGTGTGRDFNGSWVNNVFEYAFGDAAIVADRESDEVLVMCVGGKQAFPYATATSHNYVARLCSHDGGVTWDDPENLTAMFMEISQMAMENPEGYEPVLPEAYSMFYGSGRILQSRMFKKEGSRYYRLYAALLVREVLPGASGASHNNHVVYSDDFGATWHTLGGVAVPGGDEAKVEELPDGTIVISSRKSYGRYFNIFTFTNIAAGEGNWSTAVASHAQTGGIAFGANACNGELLKVPVIRKSNGVKCDIMLQSIPTGNSREKVAVYFKEMDYSKAYTPTTFAQNWTKGMEVSDRGSAYSAMTVQADGRIGFFYEEEPNGYCMVYVPLTIEEITNGMYGIDEEATSIEETELETSVLEYIYDLQGRRVQKPEKGVYIVNGKKVLY